MSAAVGTPHCILCPVARGNACSRDCDLVLLQQGKDFSNRLQYPDLADLDDLDALGPTQGGGRRGTLQRDAPPAAPVAAMIDTASVLEKMAETFREHNLSYSDNYRMVAPIMKTLFPEGVPMHVLFSDSWHLFELIIVKLTRFAISGLTHEDSIQDAGVYCAMINAIILQEEIKKGKS